MSAIANSVQTSSIRDDHSADIDLPMADFHPRHGPLQLSPPPPEDTPPPPLTPLAAGGRTDLPDPDSGLHDNPIGVYGWRKRCLYFLVLLLVVIILVNLGLTIWILAVMDFNAHGMGNLRITDSGIRLEATAEFIGPLYAQNISADLDSSLVMTSHESIEMSVATGTRLSMNNSTVNITTAQFQVTSRRGDTTTPSLTISDDELTIGASQLRVTGSRGLSLDGALETDRVTSEPNEDLMVDASSGLLRVIGSRGITITDGPGFSGVEVTSNEDLSLSTQNGAVVLTSPTIQLSGVHRTQAGAEVYEVCACASGRLYLVPATSSCQDDQGFCN